ncbi:hypothetical protein OFN63_36455, partial [Escherichia coli]|nr:hypothetical protein [Escherichia coli]
MPALRVLSATGTQFMCDMSALPASLCMLAVARSNCTGAWTSLPSLPRLVFADVSFTRVTGTASFPSLPRLAFF